MPLNLVERPVFSAMEERVLKIECCPWTSPPPLVPNIENMMVTVGAFSCLLDGRRVGQLWDLVRRTAYMLYCAGLGNLLVADGFVIPHCIVSSAA